MVSRLLISLTLLFSFAGEAFAEKEVVVYSARKKHLVKPVFDRFTKETGIKIKLLTDKAGVLVEKLKAEGEHSPADILLTVDAGNLWQAAEQGLFAAVESEVLSKNIPSHLKDPENRWFGFSVRARTIVYNPDKVSSTDLNSYEDLADRKWKNKLCLRTSKKVYNQSLVAMMIAEHGETKTANIVKGWVENLAAPVFSNDTKVLKAIASGQCQVGIVNTYYFGRLIKKDPNLPLKIFWPNQNSSGVHVNISGGGLLKHAKNKRNAKVLLEWLSGKDAQEIFAGVNMEYPVATQTPLDEITKSWGTFQSNTINVSKAGQLQSQAIKLMDRANYH